MLTLRPLNKKDIPLVARWLYGKHAASWVESPEDWLADLHDKDTAFTHIIAEVDGNPMACCRTHSYSDNGYNMDYLIGALEYIPPGFDRVMLDRMLSMLKSQGAKSVSITPEENDKAACAFLESCYFQWDGGFYTYFLR